MRPVFHYSFPVHDLELAERFYVEVLGGRVGRRRESWIDILIWGQQLTLQLRPDEVLAAEAQGVRHFGVILEWSEWERVVARLQAAGVEWLVPPQVRRAGEPDEQGKLYLADPSGNVLEIKTYRDLEATFGAGAFEPDAAS